MTTRDEFATALSAVPGVKGYAYKPAAPVGGDAWPLWSSTDRAEAFTFVVSWRVQIVAPSSTDEQAATKWFEAHERMIIEALNPLSFVDRLEPIIISQDNAPRGLFAIEITLRGE